MQYFVSTDDTTLLFIYFFNMLQMIIFEAFYQKENLKKLSNTWLMFVGWGAFFWSFAFRSQVSWYKEKQCKEQAAVDEWTLFNTEDCHLGPGQNKKSVLA